MIHVGDIVKIKGQHPAEEAMRVISVKGDVATLRYLSGTLGFSEYTRDLYRIACPH